MTHKGTPAQDLYHNQRSNDEYDIACYRILSELGNARRHSAYYGTKGLALGSLALTRPLLSC
jgi:hypothetical protein